MHLTHLLPCLYLNNTFNTTVQLFYLKTEYFGNIPSIGYHPVTRDIAISSILYTL